MVPKETTYLAGCVSCGGDGVEMIFDRKGQAAVTDALFFLVIITGLSAFLYFVANGYGSTVTSQLSRQFSMDYATAALKTILYSSTPRDPSQSLYDPDAEIDHLLAFVKEDYADDQEIDVPTQRVLYESVRNILAPIADSYDYIFYIAKSNVPSTDSPYVYILMHFSKATVEGGSREAKFIPGSPPHEDLLCNFPAPTTGTRPLKAEMLSRLINTIGDSPQSQGKLILMEQAPGEDPRQVSAFSELILWQATLLDPNAFNYVEWGCRPGADPWRASRSCGAVCESTD